MAAIGIMSYGIPSNLKLKNTFNKITITTNNSSGSVGGILSENAGNKLVINKNSIVKKIKDFGMTASVNNSNNSSVIMRKKQKLIPLNQSNCENVLENVEPQQPAKKMKFANKSVATKIAGNEMKITVETVGTPGRKGLPAPQAVARRNARERNRVKQVNNGFAALRQHIPEEIAQVYETTGAANRGSAKKLSKVETLRMAVEYIRGLEKLLGYEIPPVSPLSGDDCFAGIKDEFGPSSPMNDNFDNYDDNSNSGDQDVSQIADNLPHITTLNGLQYIRIPGTNTYQLLTADLFGNEENFNPLIDGNCYPNDDIIDEDPVSMLPSVAPVTTPSMMSPPISTPRVRSPLPRTTSSSSSSSSLSPAAGGILLQQNVPVSRGNNDHYMMPPQFSSMHDAAVAPHHHHIDYNLARVKVEPSDIVYHQQHLLGNSSPHLDVQGFYITTQSGENSCEDQSLYDGVIRLKKEYNDVILDTSTAALSDESMMDAIDWWEANTPKSDGGNIM